MIPLPYVLDYHCNLLNVNKYQVFIAVVFLSTIIGARANKAIFKTAVVDLDSSNFDSVALDKTKDVLVEFYAPCKDCI